MNILILVDIFIPVYLYRVTNFLDIDRIVLIDAVCVYAVDIFRPILDTLNWHFLDCLARRKYKQRDENRSKTYGTHNVISFFFFP